MVVLRSIVTWAILTWASSAAVFAAHYQGDAFTYQQPDGSTFTVHLWGDEDYADEETADGWRIVRDPVTRAWCYARLSADGLRLASTGLAVGAGDPAALGLAKHLRIARDERLRLHRLSQRARHCDPRGRPLPPGIDGLAAAADDLVAAPPSAPTTGSRRGLTLLLSFPDRLTDATISQVQVDAYCNQAAGYTGFSNNGSVREYFYEVSGGRLTYTNHVAEYLIAGNDRAYYTDETVGYGTRARELITEALVALEDAGFDFRTVDADGNGVIDALNCFYAGNTVNAWAKGLWPHASSMSWTSARTGIRTGRYQITNMGASLSLGTFCHENGHMLCGYPDLYDYDGSSSGGAGSFCLMNSGGHGTNPRPPCGYLRYKAGWGTVTAIDGTTNTFASLTAQNGSLFNNQFLLHARSATEYFLVENRWKNDRDSGLPTGGIAIWHIDQLGNRDNESYAHQATHLNYECALIQADNLREHERSAGSDADDLYYSGNPAAAYAGAFHDSSDAGIYDNNAHWWDGTNSGLRLSNFSVRGGTMTFLVGTGAVVVTAPNGGQTLTGGAATTVTWTSYGTVGNVTIAVSSDGGGTWQNLLADTPNDGTQAVTLPSVVSSTCLMRVSQSAGTVITDVSDAFFTITGANREMDLARQGVRLADGGSDVVDYSVVGVTGDLVYTITNPGGASLGVTTPVTLTPPSNCTASITVQPPTSIAAAGSGTCTLRVTPTATGPWSVAVSVANNDADENPYNWTVSGTAVAQPVALLKRGLATIADGGSDALPFNLLGDPLALSYRLGNEAVAGSASLELSPVTISGQVNCTATVTAQPVADTAPGFNAPFTVLVTPTAAGAWSFNASIPTNDADRAPYNWSTSGIAVTPLVITTASPLADGSVGVAYHRTLAASGGTGTGRIWMRCDGAFTETTSASGGTVGGGISRGWSGDNNAWLYVLPFPFRFYGTEWDRVYVSANGYLEFAASAPASDTSPTAAELQATKRIAPLWMDLSTTAVFITEDAGRVVIRWTGTVKSPNQPMEIEAILERNGTITFAYGTALTLSGVKPVIGVSAGDNSRFTLSTRSGTAAIAAGARAVFTQAGVLPPGLQINAAGAISGTPTATGTTVIPVLVEDSAHQVTRANLSVTIGNAPLPDLDLWGGSPLTAIANGDATPATTDGTAFGNVDVAHAPVARTFTIRNTGSATLTLTGATPLSLTGDAQFAITAQPGSTSIAAGGSTTCTVTLTPTTIGNATTTLALASNDPDEAPFTCTLAATIVWAPPVITLQPLSRSVPTGSTVTLTVTATGNGLGYQWYQGASGDTTTPIVGATGASYTTPVLTSATSCWVRVANPGGSVNSSTAAITILQPPVITVPPAALAIASGATATLTVTATGASLSYQWYQGDSGDLTLPVAGATTATCITPVLTTTTGFWVRVSNPGGSADSPTATVSVSGGTTTTGGDGGGGGGGSCGLGSSITGLLAGLLLFARLRLRR